MSTTANRGAGVMSRFAHFAGIISKPKAEEEPKPAEADDLDDVEEKIEDVKDDVEEVKDDVDDIEERVDDLEDDKEPAADKPEARASYRKGVAAGRKAERARAGAILAAPVAAKNRNLALHLAFEGDLPAKQAVALLKASAAGAPDPAPAPTPPANGNRLDARMSGSKPVNLGSDGAAGPDLSTHAGLAAHAINVAKRVGIIAK